MRRPDRRGAALLAVLLVLLLLGVAVATVSGSAASALTETRRDREALHLLEAAESGIVLTLRFWPAAWNYLPVGGSDSIPFQPLTWRTGYAVRADRLTGVLYEIEARSAPVSSSGGPVAPGRLVRVLVHLPLDSARAARPDTVLPPVLDTLIPVRIPGPAWVTLVR